MVRSCSSAGPGRLHRASSVPTMKISTWYTSLLANLQPGDSYRAISTPRFWKQGNLGHDGDPIPFDEYQEERDRVS